MRICETSLSYEKQWGEIKLTSGNSRNYNFVRILLSSDCARLTDGRNCAHALYDLSHVDIPDKLSFEDLFTRSTNEMKVSSLPKFRPPTDTNIKPKRL